MPGERKGSARNREPYAVRQLTEICGNYLGVDDTLTLASIADGANGGFAGNKLCVSP